ncbi:MAG: Calx-beta domain-containing protein, partial [Trichodesmium sp.]
ATEGGATGSYQVFLTTQPIGDVSINFNTDQQIQAIDPITFDQTNWNVPRTVTVTAVDDNIPETETQNIGTIAHQVFSQTDPSYNNLNISQVTVNIDDPAPTQVLINQTDQNTTFTAGGSDNYTIELNSNPTTPIEIAITPPPEIDLGSGPGIALNLEFNDSNQRNITVTGVDDGNFNIFHSATLDGIDPNLQFIVDGTPTNIVTANVIPITPGTLQFSAPSFSVDENTPTNNATVTVTRTGGSDGVVSADIDITDGTANRGGDFGDPVPETISFADGVTQQTVSIPIIDDNSDENTETANLSLTNVTGGANIGQPATATLEIIDDDPPLIANPDTASITQGDSPITINVLANDQGNFPEIIAFDNLSQAGNNVTIDGINNQIIYSLAPGFTTTEPFTDTFNYTISNNPNTPNSTAPVSVVINPPTEFPGSISGITFNDINRNGSLDPGETGLPNVTVFLDTNQNDTLDSNDEQSTTDGVGFYSFPNLSPDNYTVRTISPPDATLTTAAEISVPLSSSQNVNDTNFGYSFPNPGTLQFSNPTFSFTEGTPNATVTVIRTGGSDGVVSADINLTNGTASRGIDFGNPIPETIFFADGETEQTVSIPIFDDNSDENNETANLSLANVTGGANIGQPATATLEIIDNDDRIEPQPLSINTEVFGFEQFTNFARFSFIPVDTPQGPANLRFSSNAIALVSNNISGGEGRFNVNPNINNTVIAYDTGNAIRIDLDDIINQVGEIESGNLLFDYASPNRSHTVTFLDENNQQLEERFLPQTSSGQFLNDFSNFNSTNIPIPEDTQFIDIGSEATELGIDNLQLTLQTEGILTESNIDSFF